VRPFVHESLPRRIVFGIGAVERVGDEVADLGSERVLLVADGNAAAIADGIAAQLGARLAARVGEVQQHVPEQRAAEARKVAADVGADGIVSVGGGSATGLAKAVAIDASIPIVAVPTTYAGSEMTPVYGITGEHKRTGRDARALPRIVVYDPALTVDLPAAVAGPSGLNAIAHCVEALYAPGSEPIGDLYAVEGIRVLARALPAVVADAHDLDARGDALYGAQLAGMALAIGGTALHHKVCHVLGGTYRLVHGEVNAAVLPHAAAYNAPAVATAMARVAEALGGPADAGAAGGLLFDLAGAIGAPTSLAGIGMPRDGLDRAAELAVADVGATNPRPIDVPSMRALLQDAFDGRRP
jgi:maleylacetate reductase